MRRLGQHRGGDQSQGERGAAMLEFGLVSVFFFLLIFGLIDGGLLIRARSVTSDAADDAARRGAVAAGAETADFQILQQVKATGVHESARLNHVVIYRVDPDRSGPSEACRGGAAVTNECNVYSRAELDTPLGAFGCGSPELDGSWCPDRRLADGDHLGVWIDVTYNSLTGFGGDWTFGSSAELPLEQRGSAR